MNVSVPRQAAVLDVEREALVLRRRRRLRTALGQLFIYSWMFYFILFSMIPMILMIFMSFRNQVQILTNFWALPNPWLWQNYVQAWKAIGPNIINSIVFCTSAALLSMALAGIGGYVFGRHKFPGRDVLFMLILALIMIPGILTLIPAYVIVEELGLVNTPFAMILPWASGGQVGGIFLMRSYIAGLAEEVFEAARLDGASEWQVFWRVALPLSWPILVTVGILNVLAFYNDFIWPSLVVNTPRLQPVALAMWKFASQFGLTYLGPEFAGYVISSIPLVILFAFGMRYFVQGAMSGAIKL